MSDNVIDLATRKAKKDCRDWSVVECLRAAADAVESGTYDAGMVYVALRTKPDEDGMVNNPFFCAGATNVEFAGLLSYHLHMHIDAS